LERVFTAESRAASSVDGADSDVGESPSPSSRSKLPQRDDPTLGLVDVTTNKSDNFVCDPPILFGPLSPNKYESSEHEDERSPPVRPPTPPFPFPLQLLLIKEPPVVVVVVSVHFESKILYPNPSYEI